MCASLCVCACLCVRLLVVAELSLSLSECVALLRTVRCAAVDDSAGSAVSGCGEAGPETEAANLVDSAASAAMADSSSFSALSALQQAASLRASAALSSAPLRPEWGGPHATAAFSPPSALSLLSAAGSAVGVATGSASTASLLASASDWSVPANRSIFTLCQKLDWLLGDGVRLSELTEFCGVPGVGQRDNRYISPTQPLRQARGTGAVHSMCCSAAVCPCWIVV